MPLPKAPVFQWKTREYQAGLERELLKRTARAAELVKGQVQRNLRTPYRTAGPSAPGEYPHARTGLLLKSIQTRVESTRALAWVYTNLTYGLFLEYSTKYIRDRSFLRRTLWEMRAQVKAIYMARLPSGLAGGGRLVVGRKAG